jgi:Mrp family chromosome partitioning ATPase
MREDHHSSEATLIDDGSGYRAHWDAPVSRSTTRMMAKVVAPPTSLQSTMLVAAPAPRLLPLPAPQSFWCNPDRRLAMLSQPDSACAAGFRRLRDALLTKGMPRVLAITSAAPHEGKTTCATNLALAFAEHTREKLLLLDANFFAPALASMFSIDEYAPAPHAHAHAPLLPWSAPFRLTSLTPRLDLGTLMLTRGEALPRVDHAHLVRLLGAFFNAGYDRVILDAPALEGSPAVTRLLEVADGVLLAVRAGHTSQRALRRAVDQIGPNKMMGAALIESQLHSG